MKKELDYFEFEFNVNVLVQMLSITVSIVRTLALRCTIHDAHKVFKLSMETDTVLLVTLNRGPRVCYVKGL